MVESKNNDEHQRAWPWLLCALASVTLASLSKFDNRFVWDDIAALRDNDFYHHWENLWVAFGNNTMFGSDGGKSAAISSLDTYRPVTLTTFFIDASWSGFDPFGFHLTNLLAHLFVITLIFVFARRMMPSRSPMWAFIPALWFGLHPHLSEAHVFINGRSDLFCAVFGLSSILLWCRAREVSADTQIGLRAGLWVGTGLLFLLSLLSKEVIVMAIPVLLLWDTDWLKKPFDEWTLRQAGKALLHTLPMVVATGIYTFMRISALSGLKTSGGESHILLALFRAPWLLLESIVRAFVSFDGSVRYLSEEYERHPDWVFISAWVAILALAVAAFKFRQRAPVLVASWIWFCLILAPASLIATGLRWYGWGRYLYIPLAGLALGVTVFAARRAGHLDLPARTRRIIAVGAVSIALFMGISQHMANDGWQDNQSWYRSIIAGQPYSSHGYGGLGKLLVEEGNHQEAVQMLVRAFENNPSDDRYLNNLLIAYLHSDRCDVVVPMGLDAARRFPREAKFLYVVGLCMRGVDREKACTLFLEALLRSPRHSGSLKEIHNLTHNIKARQDWRATFEKLLSSEPRYKRIAPLVRQVVDAGPPASPGGH